MAVTKRKDGRWICYYRDKESGGKIKQEYFGRGKEGEIAARKRDRDLKLRRKRTSYRYIITFASLAKVYTQGKNFSPNSKKHLKYRLQSSILPFFGDMEAPALCDDDMDEYVQTRRADGVKDSTIVRELTDVKAILNFSVKRSPSLLSVNPVRDYIKPPEDNEILIPPTLDETEAIIAAASPHLVRAVLLSYYLGLRPGAVELLTLTWQNVNWENQTIRVWSAKKGGPVSRDVPIHAGLLSSLKTWHEEDKRKGHIVAYRGKPVKSIRKSWKGALRRAGIERRIRPYDMRHHFITKALEAGADMKALSEIVGSKPETLMKHYQHVTRAIHRQTVAKIPVIKVKSDNTCMAKKPKSRSDRSALKH